MRIHKLKLLENFAKDKIDGRKTFEIRLNDRLYKVGDFVRYICSENDFLNNVLKNRLYIITYITSFAQQNGYVVFSDFEIPKEILKSEVITKWNL